MPKTGNSAPFPAPVMGDATKKHLSEAYRHVRNAYSFLLAGNAEHARQQLSSGLTHLDRVAAPWL